ncbi:MAG: hypothetical protein ABEI07_00715, partial [Candidatus Nanohaloarchaea archaeon]
VQEVVGHSSPTTKTVQRIYDRFQERFESEIHILTDADVEELNDVNREVGDAVKKFRNDNIVMVPGGGGQYGEMIIPSDMEEKERVKRRREDEMECRYSEDQASLEKF